MEAEGLELVAGSLGQEGRIQLCWQQLSELQVTF